MFDSYFMIKISVWKWKSLIIIHFLQISHRILVFNADEASEGSLISSSFAGNKFCFISIVYLPLSSSLFFLRWLAYIGLFQLIFPGVEFIYAFCRPSSITQGYYSILIIICAPYSPVSSQNQVDSNSISPSWLSVIFP